MAEIAEIADLYSTFVNGRSRDLIMVEMRERIDRADIEREIIEIIQVYIVPLSIWNPYITLTLLGNV